jgi:hypothetical protein
MQPKTTILSKVTVAQMWIKVTVVTTQ